MDESAVCLSHQLQRGTSPRKCFTMSVQATVECTSFPQESLLQLQESTPKITMRLLLYFTEYKTITFKEPHECMNGPHEIHGKSGIKREDKGLALWYSRLRPWPEAPASHMVASSSPGCPSSDPALCCGLGKQ